MSFVKETTPEGDDLFVEERAFGSVSPGRWFTLPVSMSKADYNANLTMAITGLDKPPTTKAKMLTEGNKVGVDLNAWLK